MTEPKPILTRTAHERHGFHFSCEKLAEWFFRLNGCLNLTNFLIHHEINGREGTEIDVLGVRFQYRAELSLASESITDHEIFTSRKPKIDIVIADSTVGKYSKVNPSWILPEKLNMQRILFALGVFHPEQVEKIAQGLYKDLFYENKIYRINIYALGKENNTELSPAIIQITWDEILEFIHHRFVTFEDYKTQNVQWDSTGRMLFELATHTRKDCNSFVNEVMSNLTK